MRTGRGSLHLSHKALRFSALSRAYGAALHFGRVKTIRSSGKKVENVYTKKKILMNLHRFKFKKSFLKTISLWNIVSKKCDIHNMMLGIVLQSD